MKDLEHEAEELAAVLDDHITLTLAGPKVEGRFAALEARIAKLEAQPVMKDAGVWRHGSRYAVGDVTTFKGSPWVCTKAHLADGPVADHTYWRLLMKGTAR